MSEQTGVKFVLVLAAALGVALVVGADQPRTRIEIPVNDLEDKVVLIGRLGKPLGQMTSVRGSWALPQANVKDYSLIFTVTHVDGKPLAKPAQFNTALVRAVDKTEKRVEPKDGDQWTLRAYETGSFQAVPFEYYQELGQGPPATPSWLRAFTSNLVGIVQPE